MKSSHCKSFRRLFAQLGTLGFAILLSLNAVATTTSTHPSRTVVIGDIHGDLSALKIILKGKGLIDKYSDAWIGRNAALVTMGDLIDRGPQSRAVMDFLINLELEAREAGGVVHNLLGNHELLAVMGKNELYLNMNDPSSFRDFRQGPRQSSLDGYFNAFRGQSPYAKWIRERKAMVKIGDSLFVHAGLDEWALQASISEVNDLLKAWIEFEQGVGVEPPTETSWVREGKGPLWSRRLAIKMDSIKDTENKNMLPLKTLERILHHLGVKRVFIGHSLVANLQQALNHPIYKDQVVMTDLGLTESDKGIVVGFELGPHGELSATHFGRKFGETLGTYVQEKTETKHSSSMLCHQL